MEVFRLSKVKFADTLSGKGAAINGARWNSQGFEVLYTASNRSLAMAEVVVHLSMGSLPPNFVMLTIYVPDHLSIQKLRQEDLPENWKAFPHLPSTQTIGNEFIIESKYCGLQIPSVVTECDYNLLFNPHHKEFRGLKIIDVKPFPFDLRMVY